MPIKNYLSFFFTLYGGKASANRLSSMHAPGVQLRGREIGRSGGLSVVVCVVFSFIASNVYAIEHGDRAKLPFNIPKQQADQALVSYAEQTGVTFVFPFDGARKITANPLVGTYSKEEAINILLLDTGLEAEFGTDGVLIVRFSQNSSLERENKPVKKRGLFASVLAILVGGGGQAQEQGGQPAANNILEEIVVTASKREEKLSNVPTAMVALGSAQIETLGITKVDDYIGLIPNLTQISQGAAGASNIVIRGLYTGSNQLTTTTAYYLDEAVVTASGTYASSTMVSPDADLADVERIEVLKGPQSTLYGANALGGILRVISKKPDSHTLSGSVRGDLSVVDGGGTGYGIRGSINLPLAEDKAAMRVNAFHRRDAGYVDNVATGKDNVNRVDVSGVRMALRLTPNDQLTIDLNALYQDIDVDGSGVESDLQNTTTPAFGLHKRWSPNSEGPSETRYRTVGGTLAYETEAGTFTATASYAKFHTVSSTDASYLYAPFLAFFADPGATVVGTTTVGANKKTAEVRFASNRFGPVEFLAGAFYTRESNIFQTDYPVINPDGNPPPFFDGLLIFSPNPGTYKEHAGFGDMTFYLTEDLDITGGFRYSKNKQFVDSQTYGFFSLFFPNALYRFEESVKNYLATVRWRPNETTNVYLRAASGYRPGGPNIGATYFPPYTSDTLWNYEAGIKGSLMDNRLVYNLAVYHIDWKDVQLPGQDPISSSVIGTNGGGANVDGAELDLTMRPADGLTVSAGLGYNKTKLTSLEPDVAAVIGAVVGDAFPMAPKWTGSIVTDYVFSISDQMEGSVGASIKMMGSRDSNFPGAGLAGNVELSSFTTFDLRAGVTIDSRYKLMARVENLTDSHGITNHVTSRLYPGQPDVYSSVVRIRPRTFMLTAGVDF